MSRGIVGLSGAHGFIGSKVALALVARGYEVWPLVRKKTEESGPEIFYDYNRQIIDKDALSQCTAVVHLAGKNIMSGLWSDAFKKELWESRVASTRLIAGACADLRPHGPKVLVCASAVGFYGDGKKEKLDEKCIRGMGFLAQLCEAWEEETRIAQEAGIRVVNMRFGAVLGQGGGMLAAYERIFSLGLGAVMGSGKQYMALVALEDVVRAILFALEKPLAGPVNVVMPEPITNEDFSKRFARALKKKVWIRVPAWVLKALGEQGKLVLSSCRAVPRALLELGFEFSKPTIKDVLQDNFGNKKYN